MSEPQQHNHPQTPKEHALSIREQILEDAGNGELNQREARFVIAFFDEPTIEKAALAAGYTANTAKVLAGRWLDEYSPQYKPHVHSEIRRRQRAITESHMITVDDLVSELKGVVFTDPLAFFNTEYLESTDADGEATCRPRSSLKDIADIPASARASIEEIEQIASADGKTIRTKFKMRSKDAAIDKLMKYLGGYERDNMQRAVSFVVLAQPLPDNAAQSPSGGPEASIVDHNPTEIAQKRNFADMEQSNQWLVKNGLPDPKQV